MKYYVTRNGETVGPVEEATVVSWIRSGMREGMVAREGESNWVPLAESNFKWALQSHVPVIFRVMACIFVFGCIWYFYFLINVSSKSSKTNEVQYSPAPVITPVSASENNFRAQAEEVVRAAEEKNIDLFKNSLTNLCHKCGNGKVTIEQCEQVTETNIPGNKYELKDLYSFHEECLPAMEKMTCKELTKQLPLSCRGQLIK